MITIRGLKLIYVMQFIQENYDPSIWKRILDSAEPDIKEILVNPISANKMYDIRAERHMLERFWKETSYEDLVKCAEDGARKQLIGLFGFVAKFISIDRLIPKAQWMWDRAFSQGKVTVTKMVKNEYKIDVSPFEFNDAHRIFVQHYLRTLIEMAYHKKVSCSSMKKGETSYQFFYTITEEDLPA